MVRICELACATGEGRKRAFLSAFVSLLALGGEAAQQRRLGETYQIMSATNELFLPAICVCIETSRRCK